MLAPLRWRGILETRLGLGGLRESRPLRVMQYLQCLKAVDDGTRFYRRSLAKDELITARTLLSWRDQWIEAGWDGRSSPTDSGRLRDLACVEALAVGQVAVGLADRLRAVWSCLDVGAEIDVDVAVVDPLEELSWSWQNILRLLKARLAAGSLARIDTGNRQKGNLLHQLCETLFTSGQIDWRSAGDAELERWVRENFEVLLQLEEANFFLPGQTVAREELLEGAVRAVFRLVHHLRNAGIVSVQMEAPVKDLFQSGELTGSIDMLLAKASGEEAVLDLKWGEGSTARMNWSRTTPCS